MKLLYRIWLTFMVLTGLVAVLGAGTFIGSYVREYEKGSESYGSLDAYIQKSEPSQLSESVPEESEPLPDVDFESLKAINPDIAGWIFIPDTRISYPVVKRENDNTYYLDHLFDGSSNSTGCIFLDTRCDLGDRHTLIHGHNMANGSMFRDLTLFKNRQFFQEHPYALILTPEENYVVEFFAGSVVRIDSPVWQLAFSGESDVMNWLSQCRKAASVFRELPLTAEDSVITLSTCTYEYTQARWIVQGRLRSEDSLPEETMEILLSAFCSGEN